MEEQVIVWDEPEELEDFVDTFVCQVVSEAEAEAQARFFPEGIDDLEKVKSTANISY